MTRNNIEDGGANKKHMKKKWAKFRRWKGALFRRIFRKSRKSAREKFQFEMRAGRESPPGINLINTYVASTYQIRNYPSYKFSWTFFEL